MDPLDELFEKVSAEHASISAQLQPLEQAAAKLWANVEAATREWKAAREKVEALKAATNFRAVSAHLASLARSRRGKNHSLSVQGG